MVIKLVSGKKIKHVSNFEFEIIQIENKINILLAPKINFKKSVQDSLSNFGNRLTVVSIDSKYCFLFVCLLLIVLSSFTVIFHLVPAGGLFFIITWKYRAILAPIKLVSFRVDSDSVEFHSCASLFNDFRLHAHGRMTSKTTSNADNVEQEHLEHYESTRERYKGSCLFSLS